MKEKIKKLISAGRIQCSAYKLICSVSTAQDGSKKDILFNYNWQNNDAVNLTQSYNSNDYSSLDKNSENRSKYDSDSENNDSENENEHKNENYNIWKRMKIIGMKVK
ncbi:16466_t:CDS:2 [Gigaspora rosea]|nr:16466_t:CDS:2 [Gigaspora rosea]